MKFVIIQTRKECESITLAVTIIKRLTLFSIGTGRFAKMNFIDKVTYVGYYMLSGSSEMKKKNPTLNDPLLQNKLRATIWKKISLHKAKEMTLNAYHFRISKL